MASNLEQDDWEDVPVESSPKAEASDDWEDVPVESVSSEPENKNFFQKVRDIPGNFIKTGKTLSNAATTPVDQSYKDMVTQADMDAEYERLKRDEPGMYGYFAKHPEILQEQLASRKAAPDRAEVFVKNAAEGASILDIDPRLQAEAEKQIGRYKDVLTGDRSITDVFSGDPKGYEGVSSEDLAAANEARDAEMDAKFPGAAITGQGAGFGATALTGGLALEKGLVKAGMKALPAVTTATLATTAGTVGPKSFTKNLNEGKSVPEALEESAEDVGTGFVTDLAVPVGAAALKKGVPLASKVVPEAGSIANKLDEASNIKTVQSLHPTPSQYKNLGDEIPALGKQMKEEGIAALSPTTMSERLAELKKNAGDTIGSYVKEYDAKAVTEPGSVPQFNAKKIIDETQNEINQLKRTDEKAANALESELNEFRKYSEDVPEQVVEQPGKLVDEAGRPLSVDQKVIPGRAKRNLEEIYQYKSGLGGKAYREGGPTGAGANAKNALKRFERRIDAEVFNTLDKSVKGEGMEGFLKAKKQYRLADRLEEVADLAAAKEQLQPIVSPETAGGFALSAATGKAGPATIATGYRAAKQYGRAAQGMAYDKLARLTSRLKVKPQGFGKYAEPLQRAASQGANSLAAINFTLSQRDPEYRKMLEQMDKEDENQQ